MDYLGHQKIVATVSLIVIVILLSLTLSSCRSNHKQVDPAILTKDVSASIVIFSFVDNFVETRCNEYG